MSDDKYRAVASELIDALKRFESGATDDPVGDDEEQIRREIVADILEKNFPGQPR